MGPKIAAATRAKLARVVLPVSVALLGCGHTDHAPFASTAPTSPERSVDAGPESGILHIAPPSLPGADAPGICGRTVVPIVVDRPNLYFVVDTSGSMSTPMDQPATIGAPSRYDAAEAAIRSLLLAVGHRVNFGAALFPAESTDANDICPAGEEVFSTRPGDDASYAATGMPGPQLTALLRTLSQRTPDGLTPTAASITALKSKLLSIGGRTYAFLLTDGAPNCDLDQSCSAKTCTINIEDGCPEGAGVNCCSESVTKDGNAWCLDADPTVAAVADLEASGIDTFVIGMPGTEVYATVLNDLAVAGGTARAADPLYYPVQSSAELTSTLTAIGLSIAITCDIPLAAPPADPAEVNVYFDQSVVPLDQTNGWTWTGDDSVRIVGSYCKELQTGNVLQVQVVAGCPSVTR